APEEPPFDLVEVADVDPLGPGSAGRAQGRKGNQADQKPTHVQPASKNHSSRPTPKSSRLLPPLSHRAAAWRLFSCPRDSDSVPHSERGEARATARPHRR